MNPLTILHSTMETSSEVSNLSLFDNSEIKRNVTNKANQFTPEWAIYVETAYLGFVAVLGVHANSLIILLLLFTISIRLCVCMDKSRCWKHKHVCFFV